MNLIPKQLDGMKTGPVTKAETCNNRWREGIQTLLFILPVSIILFQVEGGTFLGKWVGHKGLIFKCLKNSVSQEEQNKSRVNCREQ
jgi:hypothetical protein